jgi:exosortase A-associated hydrolase 2
MMIQEEYKFITSGNNKLFSAIYYPDNKKYNAGILFCEPIFEEKLWAQRVLINLARHLASKNFLVCRFDYSGNGDSGGQFKDNTLDTYRQDMSEAINYLNSRHTLKNIFLIGFRFGAFVQLSSLNSGIDIKGMVLLEPVLNASEYIMDCLRSNLTSQMVLYKKVKYSREQLLESLAGGEIIDIDGYELTPEFYNSIVKENIFSLIQKMNFPVFIARIVRNSTVPIKPQLKEFHEKLLENKSDITFKSIETEPFWVESRRIDTKPDTLFEEIETWVSNMIKGIERCL